MELMDRTAGITGGTSGIGLESARLLASEGATVIVSGRDRARGAIPGPASSPARPCTSTGAARPSEIPKRRSGN